MMKWLTSIMFSFMLITSHPLMMVVIIISSSMMASFTLFSMTTSQWVNYILILTFIGGMMILFMYMASLTPNEKFMSKKKYIFFLMWTFMIPFSGGQNNYISSLDMFFSSLWNSISVISFIIYAILMYIMLMVFEPFNPLKAKS